MRRNLVSAIAAVAAVSAAALFHLPDMLGAHPWWGTRTGLIGAGIGAALFLALRAGHVAARTMVLSGGIGLLLAGFPAFEGKRLFAASFGDDAIAGRLWYLGWIGIAAMLVISLATVFMSSQR
ncbi:MAG: hypothetical protein JXR75_13555 [Rhodobacteraceae bacterium]|nr:hypothetical protein [Paracoccaceae bacterium]